MAYQAIVAARERRRSVAAEAGGFMRQNRKGKKNKKHDLRTALAVESERLDSLFPIWDADGDGQITKTEFRRAIKLMGVRVTDADLQAFCEM